jgi:hypothetical protein
MTVPLVRCSALPMFEGRPLIVTAQLEASQVELTVLHKRNGAFFDLTRLHFCVPADSIQPTGETATLTQKHSPDNHDHERQTNQGSTANR